MAGTLKQEGAELEFSDRAVPPAGRMGRLPLTMAWWSVCSAMFYLVVAASLALAYCSVNAIIGIVLSVIVYAAFVWISQTRINTANYYLAAVNMEFFAETVVGLHLPKVLWACVVGVAVYLLMLADVFAYILQALAYQGIFVVAWVAIALTRIISGVYERVVGDEVIFDRDRVPAFNAGGLTAWFGAAAIGLALHAIGGAAGSWSAPMTFLAAALIYSLSLRGASRERFLQIG